MWAALLEELPEDGAGGRGICRRASPPAAEGEAARAWRGRGELAVCRGSGGWYVGTGSSGTVPFWPPLPPFGS